MKEKVYIRNVRRKGKFTALGRGDSPAEGSNGDMRRLSGFVLVLALSGATGWAQQRPASIFPPTNRIAFAAKLGDWGGFQPDCEKALKLKPFPLGNIAPPPHYTDTGVNTVHHANVEALGREAKAIYRLSVCYQISNDHKYAAHAEQLLDSWATTVTGIGTQQGGSDVNFTVPFGLMGAYALKSDPAWDPKPLAAAVRKYYLPVQHATTHKNNHANWGVFLEVTSGAFLGDDKLIETARNQLLALMRSQVAEDGSLPLEICRSDTNNYCGGADQGLNGMHYTHYALYPTTLAAEIFRSLGMDVYQTPEGALLHKAYARAAAWSLHPATFPYYKKYGDRIGATKGDAYFYILQQVYPERDGAVLLNTRGDIDGDDLNLLALYGYLPLSSNKFKQ